MLHLGALGTNALTAYQLELLTNLEELVAAECGPCAELTVWVRRELANATLSARFVPVASYVSEQKGIPKKRISFADTHMGCFQAAQNLYEGWAREAAEEAKRLDMTTEPPPRPTVRCTAYSVSALTSLA